MPKVSIIVPVYNVEQYLRQCLDSICGQTLADIEIILVNDGSIDESLNILNEYAARDKRIIVIDKPNEGYGRSINRGLDVAKGEYIGIVESDDWIESDMYETLYSIAKKHGVDVVKCRFWAYDAKSLTDRGLSHMPEMDTERVINPRKNPAIFAVIPSIWSGIYNRNFLCEKKIRFLESPGASFQDTSFNYKVWAMAKRVYLTMKPLLHYRIGHEGQSVGRTDKAFYICDEFREIERFMAGYPELSHKLEMITNRVKYGSYSFNLNRLSGNTREEFRKVMAAEFSPIVRDGKLNAPDISWKDYGRLRMILEPDSFWLKIKYRFFQPILRFFFTIRRKNGYLHYKLLRLIPLYKKPQTWKGTE